MFCSHCGIKIELNDQKFCHSCGFELSKVGKNQPSELKKMIDFAVWDSVQKAPVNAGVNASTEDKLPDKPNVNVQSERPGSSIRSFWKKLNKAQISIYIFGVVLSLVFAVTTLTTRFDTLGILFLILIATIVFATFTLGDAFRSIPNRTLKDRLNFGVAIIAYLVLTEKV